MTLDELHVLIGPPMMGQPVYRAGSERGISEVAWEAEVSGVRGWAWAVLLDGQVSSSGWDPDQTRADGKRRLAAASLGVGAATR